MKLKRISYILISLLCLLAIVSVPAAKVHAEDASVTIGLTPNGDLAVGEVVTVTIIINGDNISAYTINLDYTPGLLQYQSEAENGGSIAINGTGPTTLTYTFKAIQEGRATISTSGTSVYDAEGNPLTIAHAGATIIIGNIASEEDAIKIGNDSYTLVNEYHLPKQPEGYELSYVNYKDKDIYAYQAPNQNIKVVCLQNAEGEQKWFVFDEQNQSFSPFIQYSLEGINYVIINKPDDVKLPEGFEESSLTLDNVQFTAYTDGAESGMYLVYALNQRGDSGFYYYDTDEGGFTNYNAVKKIVDYATANSASEVSQAETDYQPATEASYATPLIAKPEKKQPQEEDELIGRETLKKLLAMMVLLFVIMCVVVIILVVKNGILQSQLDDEEEELDLIERAKKDARKKAEEESDSDVKIKKISRSKGYAINEDTGEILLEEAEDNNSGVKVPRAKDKKKSKIKEEMDKKPFGIDSAFNVASAEEAPEGENVYQEPEPSGDVVDQETVEEIRKKKTEAVELEHADTVEFDLKAVNEEASSEKNTSISPSIEEKTDTSKEKVKSEREELIDTIFSDDEEIDKNRKKKNKKDRRNRKNRNKNKAVQEAVKEVPEKETASSEETKVISEESKVLSGDSKEAEKQSENQTEKKTSVEKDNEKQSDNDKKSESKVRKESEPQKVALPGELMEEDD